MPSDRRLFPAIAAIYLASRLVLYALGVRFGVDYSWQHFHDVDLLKTRLWESLLYSHAFPPFMNLLAGSVLKLSEPHANAIYQALYLAIGLCFALTSVYLLRALSLGRAASLALAAGFVLSPPFIYLESFLHYEFPAAALLALSALLFQRALASGRRTRYFALFAVCALVAYTRLTFHLVWLIAVLALALVCDRRNARAILAAALLPLLLVVALYAKNAALFGFFGASSRTGFTLALMTTQRLSPAEQRAWQRQGKLHPASRLSVYSGVDKYARYVALTPATGIPALDRIHKADGRPNYNHFALIEVSRLLMRDGRAYLAERPWDYVLTVSRGAIEYLSPTTRWHPKDPAGSPHRANRAHLDAYENLYNTLLHAFPFAPVGLYLLLLPLAAIATLTAIRRLWCQRLQGCEPEKLILYLAFNCAYVPLISCMATRGELARYRFLVEAFLWALAAIGARDALGYLRGEREALPPTRLQSPLQ